MTSVNIARMLAAGLGVRERVSVRQTEKTYPVKPEVWDNWFPFAYLAFRKEQDVRSFASIGAGVGADAIGALHAFPSLERVVVTDLDSNIVAVAEENVRKYASGVEIIALVGSLCAPLRERGFRVDLLYENLPNIPNGGNLEKGYRRASRYEKGQFGVGNELARVYLLESHLALLQDAKDRLTERGRAICSIGGRVPLALIQEIVEREGFAYRELVAGFRLQTESEEVLPGYASAEKGITFDFYPYREARALLEKEGMCEPFVERTGEELKRLLEPVRISAKEALARYERDKGYRVGHVVLMIEAAKKD
ncbi:MAG: hypothetical protein Q7S65_04885 [Nanoarchaeota archaeon]|nr:hypothetical protein [Nanoarchaeota archaeon]